MLPTITRIDEKLHALVQDVPIEVSPGEWEYRTEILEQYPHEPSELEKEVTDLTELNNTLLGATKE